MLGLSCVRFAAAVRRPATSEIGAKRPWRGLPTLVRPHPGECPLDRNQVHGSERARGARLCFPPWRLRAVQSQDARERYLVWYPVPGRPYPALAAPELAEFERNLVRERT